MRVLSLDKFKGALLGTFVGDALGMPVEGWSATAIAQYCGEPREMLPARLGKGTYTDDTEMMIGVAESFIRCQGFNGDDLSQTFWQNFNPSRGYGSGTIQVINLIKQGISWKEAAKKVFPGGSYGNGAAMRTAPVACFYAQEKAKLKKAAVDVACITHAHPLATEGAALLAWAIALALNANPDHHLNVLGFLEELSNFLSPDVNEAKEYETRIMQVRRLILFNPSPREIVSQLGNDVRASHSVCTAIYSFLSHPQSFEEAVVYAVSLGGDTDTIGAMTGAISGAYHGMQEIPKRWLNVLENGSKGRQYVEKLAEKLWEIYNQ